MTGDASDLPHHDGSERFVERAGGSDGPVTVLLVEPPGGCSSSMTIRYMHDGDGQYVAGRIDRTDAEGRWWRFELPSTGPVSYRFMWRDSSGGHLCLNGEGVHRSVPTDAADFRLRSCPPAPDWARDSVAYYIFLDRFCRHGTTPDTQRSLSCWTDPVVGEHPANVQQFYGGDLDGVETRLDHVERLGARLLVLSPFFPAPESHRYCASSFDQVDPLLGGEEALRRLMASVHRKGMRCIGDLALNHCGSTHEWFRRARTTPSSVEAQMFSFVEHPHRYVTYKDVASLPKLDFTSAETRERTYASDASPLRRWLRSPYRLDGWRFDAAAMIGRRGRTDVNRAVARGIRAAMAAERSDAFHVAEILHDPTADLLDGRWGGSVLEAGFLALVRAFCAPPDPDRPDARLSAGELGRSLRRFAAAIPWDALVSSVGIVGSHDLPRLRSVVPSRQAALLAHFLVLTFPSIPMLYAGDELGMEGTTSDLGRAPMPWPGTGLASDSVMLDEVQALVRLRVTSHGLVRGGFRWLAATDDLLAYERCSNRERVVCVAAPHAGRQSFRLPTAISEVEPLLTRGADLMAHDSLATCEVSATNGYGAWALHA